MQVAAALICLSALLASSLSVPLQKTTSLRLECAEGQRWNSVTKICATAAEDSDSSSSSSLSSSDEEESSESDSSLSSSSEEEDEGLCPSDASPPACPARDSSTAAFFAHPDSHWFYECSNGVAYCRSCPSDLVWNTRCNACDWPGQNNCATKKLL
ncbi:hypothetical protein C0J52_18876 [Blattella germanica]|nr:hypothetical protein C0J52_18876 [Blattella germanica]